MASLIHQATRTLTHDEILHLPSTPIEIVGPPGASRTVTVHTTALVADTTAGAYTNVSDAAPSLYQVGGGAALAGLTDGTTLLGVAGMQRFQAPFVEMQTGSGTFAGWIRAAGGTMIANAALVLRDDWNGSDYTDGHAADTLAVTVAFFVLDLATMTFLTTAESGWNATTRTFS